MGRHVRLDRVQLEFANIYAPMKTPLTILAVILLILVALFLFAPQQTNTPAENIYPWDIKTSGGAVSVFGVTLGSSPLQQLMDKLRDEGETAIFADEGKPPTVETFFKNISLGGFQARLIAVIDAPGQAIEDWAGNARKISPQASGARKIKLGGVSLQQAKQRPVTAMTYLPRVAYDETIIRQRFGKPDSITRLSDSEQYWFYPDKGLILNLNADSREVLHYLQPSDYDRVRHEILAVASAPQTATTAR